MIPRLAGRSVGALHRLTGHGVTFGVAGFGPSEFAELVGVDCDGELWVIGDGSRSELVRFCLDARLRWHPSIGELVRALARGECVGLLPDLARLVGVPRGVASVGVRQTGSL